MHQGKLPNTKENINKTYSRFERAPLIKIIGKEFHNEQLPSTSSEKCTTMNYQIEYESNYSIGK